MEHTEISWINPFNSGLPGLTHATYHSKALKQEVGFGIYLPPNYNDINETTSTLISVGKFDLHDSTLYTQVKADYDLVKNKLNTHGFSALTGAMGVYIQPRTKGPGHGSISRAFYARPVFIKKVLNLE